jgi:FMN phosphatase YigB (HAD superfamily)
MPPPVEAVTFDFWDTIMVAEFEVTHHSRLATCAAVLEEVGHATETDLLDAAVRAAFESYQQSWRANQQFGALDFSLSCLRQLRLPTTGALPGGLAEAIIADGASSRPQLSPNIRQTLIRLHKKGLRLGIICDVELTPSAYLRAQLADTGLLGWFHHWSFSDDVGQYKPSPRIFNHAMAGLGVSDPARICHVGDRRRTDIAGARAVGWRSVRYAGLVDWHEQGPEADFVIHDHTELLDILDCT